MSEKIPRIELSWSSSSVAWPIPSSRDGSAPSTDRPPNGELHSSPPTGRPPTTTGVGRRKIQFASPKQGHLVPLVGTLTALHNRLTVPKTGTLRAKSRSPKQGHMYGVHP